jgi:16S rRNA (uracil1498-N3)-methyltransferase
LDILKRYFIAPEQFQETTVEISGDDAHHIIRVMRAQPGDPFICSNGVNREALVKIVRLDKNVVEAEVVEELPMLSEAAVQVWIAQSLPKGDKLETVIQKCTELGAVKFIPFISARTVVQYDEKKEVKRLDRWQKIAKEAAEQAHRNRVPEVAAPIPWKQLLKLIPEMDQVFLCYEKENNQQFRSLLRESFPTLPSGNSRQIMVIIGPEGGISEKEAMEVEAAGGRSISLGARILRTETAAMVALTCILYESGEMGG